MPQNISTQTCLFVNSSGGHRTRSVCLASSSERNRYTTLLRSSSLSLGTGPSLQTRAGPSTLKCSIAQYPQGYPGGLGVSSELLPNLECEIPLSSQCLKRRYLFHTERDRHASWAANDSDGCTRTECRCFKRRSDIPATPKHTPSPKPTMATELTWTLFANYRPPAAWDPEGIAPDAVRLQPQFMLRTLPSGAHIEGTFSIRNPVK